MCLFQLCYLVQNWPVTGELPAQKVSNAENVSIRWQHHDWQGSHKCSSIYKECVSSGHKFSVIVMPIYFCWWWEVLSNAAWQKRRLNWFSWTVYILVFYSVWILSIPGDGKITLTFEHNYIITTVMWVIGVILVTDMKYSIPFLNYVYAFQRSRLTCTNTKCVIHLSQSQDSTN